MADEVAAETEQRLGEAEERIANVLSDMEDIAPVGDALLATKRGLGDASKSVDGLVERADAQLEQLKEALAALQLEAEAVERLQQTVESSSRETLEKVVSTSQHVETEFVKARKSSTEAAERLQAMVKSSSEETVEKVGSASTETQEAVDAASGRVVESVGLLQKELLQARESVAEGMERLQATVESSSSETMEKVASASELVESTRQVFEAEFKRLRFLLFLGCGLGALVSVLVIVQLLVP